MCIKVHVRTEALVPFSFQSVYLARKTVIMYTIVIHESFVDVGVGVGVCVDISVYHPCAVVRVYHYSFVRVFVHACGRVLMRSCDWVFVSVRVRFSVYVCQCEREGVGFIVTF